MNEALSRVLKVYDPIEAGPVGIQVDQFDDLAKSLKLSTAEHGYNIQCKVGLDETISKQAVKVWAEPIRSMD